MSERLPGILDRRKPRPLSPIQQAEAARLMLSYLRREIDQAALLERLPGQHSLPEAAE